MDDKGIIALGAKCELARRSFFRYCQLKAPDFYREDRAYIVKLCNALQEFYEGDYDVFVCNMPPRTGKSRTAQLLVEWILGKDKTQKIMTGSYNETLSTTFAKSVRNSIQEQKADRYMPVYTDVFPGVKIKDGDGAMNLWSLQGGYNNYLATSPSGTATGFGCTCLPAGTMIHTDRGLMDIADICDTKNDIRVLSLYHKNGIIRYNKIIAARELLSNDIIEITTETGRKIRATADHKFFTVERGYVEAGELLIGETFKTYTGDMFSMRKAQTEGWRGNVQRMLRKEPPHRNRINLRKMWEKIQSAKVYLGKTAKTWIQTHILFARMFLPNQCRSTAKENVQNMWQADTENKDDILFAGMQKNRTSKPKNAAKNMPGLRNYFQTCKQKKHILFDRMQKQSAFTEYDGRKKFKLQRRKPISNHFLSFARIGNAKRWLQMPTLWQKVRVQTNSQRSYAPEFIGTPFKQRQALRYYGKSCDALHNLSSACTQNEKIAKIEKISGEIKVYDIQVERDQNFFANSILVHNCLIVDDLIKNAKEAYNDTVKNEQWRWFTDTMLSRLEQGGKIIVIMTRWASNDLAGRVLSHFVEAGKKVMHINFKAKNDDGSMLCPEILSEKEYEFKRRTMGTDIFMANYQQEPIDLKGCLYSSFKTYEDIPRDGAGNALFEGIKSYTDTADEGSDYLCSIVYGVYQKEAYILDVLYTKKPMEITEPQTAAMFIEHKVNVADIESNNGGKGFARNVETIMRERYGWNRTKVQWFHQSANKMARILSASTGVMNHIYFPVNWKDRWAEFYEHITTFQREGKNAHDDAEDALSGVWEKLESNKKMQINTAILQRGYW